MASLDAPRWRRRPTILVLAVLLATVWYYGLVIGPRAAVPLLPPRTLTQNLDHLRKHVQTPQFTYAQRMIRAKPFVGERPDLTVVDDEPLFPDAETLDKTGATIDKPAGGSIRSRARVPLLPPLKLFVPESPRVNTSIISFGVATPVARLKESSAQFVHWLNGSEAPMYIMSPPDDKTVQMQSYMRDLGIDAKIETSRVRYPLAYFSLIKRLYETRQPHTKWLALIDDDTFLPSLPTLVEHLTTTYNAEKQTMVSAMSDNVEQIQTWGVQAFGGGGIFISVPLAARLTQPEIWDKCIDHAKGRSQGDQIISRCLNTFTDIRPMFDAGLHQMDILGPGETPSGYFESGRRMLTVHHWRTWFKVDIPQSIQVSKACGSEGLFQRWAFPRSNMVLSNGYSIAEYPKGLNEIDFAAVEKTWQGEEAKFLHKIGPLRNPVGQDKISYRLVASEVVDRWYVRQTYLYKGDKPVGEEQEMDEVLELLWLL
jgi:hypothetical protein